jgi:hypothetical protein
MADEVDIEGFTVTIQPHGHPRFKGFIRRSAGGFAHKEIATGDSREAWIADATAIIKRLEAEK